MIDFKRDPGLWVAVLLWCAVCLFVDSLVGTGMARAVRSESFEQAPGVVTKSEITGGHKGGVDFDIEYTFVVNGQWFTGTEYHVQPQIVGNGYWRAASESLPVGTVVTVHFDPRNPSDAVLVPGFRADQLLAVWMLMPFNLVMVGMLYSVGWPVRKRREFDPALTRCVRPTAAGWLVRVSPLNGVLPCTFFAFLGVSFVGFFVGIGAAFLFDGGAPLWFVIPLWVVGTSAAIWLGPRISHSEVLDINAHEGLITFPLLGGRRTVRFDQALGVDVVIEPRTKNRVQYDEFIVRLRWRDDFDREQVTQLASYADRVNADALTGWLREHLGVPAAPPLAEATTDMVDARPDQ